MTPHSRFMRHVYLSSTGCWNWTGYRQRGGYGLFRLGPTRQAHRVSYELHVGPIPGGMEMDHLCRNRSCVNPAHLEPVTRAEHARRSLSARKRLCVRGHALAADNLSPRSDGRRVCRECARLATARFRLRQRAV